MLKQNLNNVILAVFVTFLLITLAVSKQTPLFAISMRHDIAESAYLNLCAPYDAVAYVASGIGVGTGTLVSSTKVLTAAHVVDTNSDGVLDDPNLNNYEILFGADITSPDYAITSIDSIVINPSWVSSNGLAHFDMAVITLSSPFNSITPMTVSDANALGRQGVLAGYGLNGTGQAPFENGDDGVRRCSENVIDYFESDVNDGLTLQADFDSPAGNTNELGSSTPLALEGGTASGDSGGPLLVDFGSGDQIVGVLNGGFNNFGDSSEYGDVSIWAPVNDATNKAFLQSNGVTVDTLDLPIKNYLPFITSE